MLSRGDNIQAETGVTLSLIKWRKIKDSLGIHSNMYKCVKTMQSLRLGLNWGNAVSLIELGELPRKIVCSHFEVVKMSREVTPLKKFYIGKNKWGTEQWCKKKLKTKRNLKNKSWLYKCFIYVCVCIYINIHKC